MKKFFYTALLIQIILSIIIATPYLSSSTKEFLSNSHLNEEERKEKIYGYFYRSMKEYITKIPTNENAVIIEPPGEYADLFWILNYYYLPRKIYVFPDYSSLTNEIVQKYNIKYVILTQENQFYFKRLEPK